MSLDVTPRPGAAPARQRIRAHARLELSMLIRNGEQLLLTVIIPLGLLLALSLTSIVDLGVGDDRVARLDVVVPGMLALAVLSTAFTALAIQTGFERRYGVLKRLGSTPLTRQGLLAGKALAVLVVEAGQLVLLGGIGWLLGWRPHAFGLVLAVALMILGTGVFASLGLFLAGTARAEATLALANVVYLALLGAGGIVVPVSRLPESMTHLVELLPSAALADALRQATQAGSLDVAAFAVLVCWLVVGVAATARWFHWD
jgi:ABC-2 type transport system permease protein